MALSLVFSNSLGQRLFSPNSYRVHASFLKYSPFVPRPLDWTVPMRRAYTGGVKPSCS